MTNKKTLKEVFEFFPSAKWITQDKIGCGSICVHEVEPTKECDYWYSDECFSFYQKSSHFNIDWENRKIWKHRCVSRVEIMGEENDQ